MQACAVSSQRPALPAMEHGDDLDGIELYAIGHNVRRSGND